MQIISLMITLSKVKSFYLRATDPAGGGWGHEGGGHFEGEPQVPQ